MLRILRPSWWRKNWDGKPEEEPEYVTTYVWQLNIKRKTASTLYLEGPDIRTLWPIYHWYLVKTSEKYNATWKNGMSVIERDDVQEMTMNKRAVHTAKQEINDET